MKFTQHISKGTIQGHPVPPQYCTDTISYQNIPTTKVCTVKAVVFPVVMYRCESWTRKEASDNWCFQTVVLEKTLESPLECKEIKEVHPKENQPWIFTGRADAEAPILWSPDVKSQLIGKDPDAGKGCRQEEKEVTEDEMVGWHHQLNRYEFEQTGKIVKDRETWHAAVHAVAKSWT